MTASSAWPSTADLPDPSFVAMACFWMQDPAEWLLGFIWTAYDDMCTQPPWIERRDLERSITQLLDQRIRKAMTGFEPFYIQHGPYEHETMAAPPAQPPAYDLAFVLLADERVMWPLEAKVLETPGTLAQYRNDVRDQFLTCRYAPFSSSGAMLGYLLSGTAIDALNLLAAKLGCILETVSNFPTRPHRVSHHIRNVPSGKAYPKAFGCHHLILEYPGLRRYRAPTSSTGANEEGRDSNGELS